MAGPVVANTPNASFWSAGGTIEHDLDLWVTGFTVNDEPDTIDMGTFAQPTATDFGRSQATVTIRFRVGPDLYDVLDPLRNTRLLFVGRLNEGDAKQAQGHVKFSKIPWGDVNIGEAVEAELTCAVIDEIEWSSPLAGSGS